MDIFQPPLLKPHTLSSRPKKDIPTLATIGVMTEFKTPGILATIPTATSAAIKQDHILAANCLQDIILTFCRMWEWCLLDTATCGPYIDHLSLTPWMRPTTTNQISNSTTRAVYPSSLNSPKTPLTWFLINAIYEATRSRNKSDATKWRFYDTILSVLWQKFFWDGKLTISWNEVA